MSKSSDPTPEPSGRGDAVAEPDGATPAVSGDVYTMAEAARLKGVSYHTVSRAVRKGKLPVQRLGRMALVSAEDLRDWRPMRERAPRKYRRREPNPGATPALLDLASGERVDLARRLSTIYEVLHSAAANRPLDDFLDLLSDRLASALDFRRVVIWALEENGTEIRRLASFGRPLSVLPDVVPLAEAPFFRQVMDRPAAFVIDDIAALDVPVPASSPPVVSLFGAPLRVGGRLLGLVFCDCAGDDFRLSQAQLDLAQVLANQAALALEQARLRSVESQRLELLTAVLEDLGEAVCACDAAGRLTLTNAADRALMGVGEDDVPAGTPVAAMAEFLERTTLDGRPIPADRMPLLRALAGERIHNDVYRVRRVRDGVERVISVNARQLRDGETVLGAVAVARDVSGEHAVAITGHERAGRLAAVADIALAVNVGSDLPTTLDIAMTRMVDLLGGTSGAIFFREADGRMIGQVDHGFDEQGIVGLELDPLIVPTTMMAFARRAPIYYTYDEASASERDFFDRYRFRSALIVPLIVGRDLIGVAYVNRAPSAARPTAEDLDFAATIGGQCAAAIDKARLVAASEADHNRLRAVVDQLPQGVLIAEAPHGQVVLANRVAEELWGGSRLDDGVLAGDLAVRSADGDLFPPGETPLERTLRTGETRFGEPLIVTRPDGDSVTVLGTHAPLVDAGGRITGAVGVLQDVAQLRALDRAKDEFLSIVAHELRNPLTSLRGNLQLLARRIRRVGDPGRDEELARLDAVIAQTDRMGELVGRLLDVSRVDLGRLDLAFAPIDAADLVRRAVANAAGLSKRHAFVAEVPESSAVVWDGVRIDQVLTNLLSNAAKYTPGGMVRVVLRETDRGWLHIVVIDQGEGVADAVKARLFERYYRAPSGNGGTAHDGPRTEGLGLGLYVSQRIVQSHGGALRVEDAPGGGASFVVELPRRAVAADEGPTAIGSDGSVAPTVSRAVV